MIKRVWTYVYRPVKNIRKFEEGVFSDLRNLKPGIDASLEESKSELLSFLHRSKCIRTQKKQKVFYWFSVPHDRLFMDALERDLKREALGLAPTSESINKMDLMSTLELAKMQCKPVIDLDNFGTMPITLPSTPVVTPAVAFDPTPVSQAATGYNQSTYLDLLSIFDAKTADTEKMPEYVPQPSMDTQNKPYGEVAGQLSTPELTVSESVPLPMSSDESETTEEFKNGAEFYDDADGTGKLHKCSTEGCGRSFKRLQHLQRHMLSHTGERPFSCKYPGCGKSFSRGDNLLVHQKRHASPYSHPSYQTSAPHHSVPFNAPLHPSLQKMDRNSKEPSFQLQQQPLLDGNIVPAGPNMFRPLNGTPAPSRNSLERYAYGSNDYMYSFM